MRTLKGIVAVAVLVFSTAAAEASSITGGFSIVGNFRPVDGLTGASTLLGSATGLDFLTLFGSTPSPGTAGTILVTQGSGLLSGLAGTSGTIRDFAFAGPGSTNYPNLSTPLVAFQNFGSLTFTLTSILITNQNDSQLGLLGTGILSMAGYTNTAGTFNFTGNSGGGTFSFSASNAGTQVPEPASLALLGGGLLVCAATLSRRRRSAKQ